MFLLQIMHVCTLLLMKAIVESMMNLWYPRVNKQAGLFG